MLEEMKTSNSLFRKKRKEKRRFHLPVRRSTTTNKTWRQWNPTNNGKCSIKTIWKSARVFRATLYCRKPRFRNLGLICTVLLIKLIESLSLNAVYVSESSGSRFFSWIIYSDKPLTSNVFLGSPLTWIKWWEKLELNTRNSNIKYFSYWFITNYMDYHKLIKYLFSLSKSQANYGRKIHG